MYAEFSHCCHYGLQQHDTPLKGGVREGPVPPGLPQDCRHSATAQAGDWLAVKSTQKKVSQQRTWRQAQHDRSVSMSVDGTTSRVLGQWTVNEEGGFTIKLNVKTQQRAHCHGHQSHFTFYRLLHIRHYRLCRLIKQKRNWPLLCITSSALGPIICQKILIHFNELKSFDIHDVLFCEVTQLAGIITLFSKWHYSTLPFWLVIAY